MRVGLGSRPYRHCMFQLCSSKVRRILRRKLLKHMRIALRSLAYCGLSNIAWLSGLAVKYSTTPQPRLSAPLAPPSVYWLDWDTNLYKFRPPRLIIPRFRLS